MASGRKIPSWARILLFPALKMAVVRPPVPARPGTRVLRGVELNDAPQHAVRAHQSMRCQVPDKIAGE